MRELEFLPEWYERRRRQRRLMKAQGWAALGLGAVLLCWLGAVRHNVGVASASLERAQGELARSRSQLAEMQRLEAVRRDLKGQEEALAKLGVPVEPSRLIAELGGAMPTEVSLLSLKVDAGQRDGEGWVRATVRGVAPTDVEVAEFVSRLEKVPVFERVSVGFSKEATEGGRALRAFEVSFSMTLKKPMGP